MLLFGIVLTLAGLGVYMDGRHARLTPSSPVGGWAAVGGRVIALKSVPGALLLSRPGVVSGHHRIAYEYEAGGVRYEKEQAMRLRVELVSDGHRRTAGSLGPGDPVLVWYDPAFPQSATVVPAGNGWPALPFILAAAGLLVVIRSL